MNRRAFLATAASLPLLSLSTTAVAAPRLSLPSRPRVLLMGDSYTQGVGAIPETEGYAYQIADPLGWDLKVDGKGGSGYLNPTGYGAGTFAKRLWRHPADAYDLVVLQGSSNDARYSSTALAGAINMTLRTVRKRFPSAQILMVGPTNPYGGAYPVVTAKLAAAARTYGVPFIDPAAERWFVKGDGAKYANSADGHPSNTGYQHYADCLVADVRRMS